MSSSEKQENGDDLDGNRPAPQGVSRMIPIAADRIDSRDLFIGTREIIIVHGGETYRLRLTTQNKLILTK